MRERERERGELCFFSTSRRFSLVARVCVCPIIEKGHEEFGVVVAFADGRERRRRQKRRREEYLSKNATTTFPRGDDEFEARDHPHWPIHFCVCFGVCDDHEFAAAASRLDREGKNDDANESERILVIRGRGFGVRV